MRRLPDVRFIADENFPGKAVDELRRAGHDVIWVRTDAPGMPDAEIFQWAVRESRVIVTFDKDFGKIAHNVDISGSCGIILFRIVPPLAADESPLLAELIGRRSDWSGCFAVIERDRIRKKPMSELGP